MSRSVIRTAQVFLGFFVRKLREVFIGTWLKGIPSQSQARGNLMAILVNEIARVPVQLSVPTYCAMFDNRNPERRDSRIWV